MIHTLKIWPQFYEDVVAGRMQFQWRRNDRDFTAGDQLMLNEYRPAVGEYTGRSVLVNVTYVLRYDRDTARMGFPEGYCILGIGK